MNNLNILLTNCWQSGNTGDVAIWKNLMRHLRKAFPDCHFFVASQTIVDWDIAQLSEFGSTIFVNNLEAAVRLSDVVISQGGGYMIGNSMAQFLKAFALAQSLNKPTFFSTQTFVGPINDATKALLKDVLNKALVVSPRDQGTYDLMVNAGVEPQRLEIVPDTVFDIGIKTVDFPYKNSVKIGLRGYNTNAEYENKIATLADMLSEAIGQVVFIPVGNSVDRDDRPFAQRVVTKMQHDGVVISEQYSAEELKQILSDGMLISDRYHGIIYAASMATPFVPFSPDIDNKMPGLLKLLNYDPKILNKNSTVQEIFDQCLLTWEKRGEITLSLMKLLPEIREKSAKVYDKIIQGIKNAGFT